jgi:hypothetical protein
MSRRSTAQRSGLLQAAQVRAVGHGKVHSSRVGVALVSATERHPAQLVESRSLFVAASSARDLVMACCWSRLAWTLTADNGSRRGGHESRGPPNFRPTAAWQFHPSASTVARPSGPALTLIRRYVLSNPLCGWRTRTQRRRNQQVGWSERWTPTPGERPVRPHPDKGCALQPFDRPSNAEPTSIPAGQHLCGAPAGIEPATPSLPWNHQEPLCGTPFP